MLFKRSLQDQPGAVDELLGNAAAAARAGGTGGGRADALRFWARRVRAAAPTAPDAGDDVDDGEALARLGIFMGCANPPNREPPHAR